MTLVTAYHDIAFDHDQRRNAVNKVCRAMQPYDKDVGIACSGLSGILVGVRAAEGMRRDFAIVRKENECTHSWNIVEGFTLKRYIIVDDIAQSYDTIRRIIDQIDRHNKRYDNPEATCCGVFLYDSYKNETLLHKNQSVPIYGIAYGKRND
jgi:orotate phosphoribosyltransferase-like protein